MAYEEIDKLRDLDVVDRKAARLPRGAMLRFICCVVASVKTFQALRP
jgi:hypothetical protein